MTDHERFRVHFVDTEARLFRLVTSDRTYLSASYVVDAARAERGGDWIVIDSRSGLVVRDTREEKRGGREGA